MKRILIGALALCAVGGMAAPAMSTLTQFASYSLATGTGANNFLYTAGSTPTLTAVTTSANGSIVDPNRAVVNFTYAVQGVTGNSILAYMNFNLTSPTPTARTSNISNLPIVGTISFTPVANSTAGASLAYTTASNLLTVFLNPSVTTPSTLWRTSSQDSVSGGTGNIPEYGADYDGNAVQFSSDFLTFDATTGTERRASIALTGDHTINSTQFIASSLGTFSSDPAPDAELLGDGPSAVPESATWAMMLAGFAIIGTSFRAERRRKAASLA